MFLSMFNRKTTRSDVALAVTGALFAVFKAWDTTNKYKADKKAADTKENQK